MWRIGLGLLCAIGYLAGIVLSWGASMCVGCGNSDGLLLATLTCGGAVGALIASAYGKPLAGPALVGALLGPIGWLIAARVSSRRASAASQNRWPPW